MKKEIIYIIWIMVFVIIFSDGFENITAKQEAESRGFQSAECNR